MLTPAKELAEAALKSPPEGLVEAAKKRVEAALPSDPAELRTMLVEALLEIRRLRRHIDRLQDRSSLDGWKMQAMSDEIRHNYECTRRGDEYS
jgi:hypothetical protein